VGGEDESISGLSITGHGSLPSVDAVIELATVSIGAAGALDLVRPGPPTV
jgi:hypothetical protein